MLQQQVHPAVLIEIRSTQELTKKHEPFVFGDEQKRAFKLLKNSIAKAITLSYFEKNAPTQVIADAGPVGLDTVLVQKQGVSLAVVQRSPFQKLLRLLVG